MVVGVLMVGVYAVKKTNFTLGGNISFTTSGITGTISKGVISNTAVVNNSNADDLMPEITLSPNISESDNASKFELWSGLDLNFNDAAEDVTIKFTITNTSEVSTEYISIGALATSTTSTNAKVTVSPSAVTLAPANTAGQASSQEFTVTLSVKEKDTNATIEDFNISLLMGLVDIKKESVEALGYTYSTNGTEATITDYTGTSETMFIPPYIKDGDTTYTVVSITNQTVSYRDIPVNVITPSTMTSIGEVGFFSYGNLENLFVSESIESIGGGAFSSCSIKSIILPSSILSIQASAFMGSELTDIYFKGTQEQWNAAVGANDIGIDTSKVTIHYNY